MIEIVDALAKGGDTSAVEDEGARRGEGAYGALPDLCCALGLSWG